MTGLIVDLVGGLSSGLFDVLINGLVVGLINGLVVGLISGLVIGLIDAEYMDIPSIYVNDALKQLKLEQWFTATM